MSTTSSPSTFSPMPQLQHHNHRQRQLQEQLEQQNRHLQRLEQYRQQPILPTHSLSHVHHLHPYYHPHHLHHYVHNPQQQPASSSPSSSLLLPPLPIEPQAPSLGDSSSQDTAFYSPISSWQQQPISPVQQRYPHTPHQHHLLQSQVSSSSPSSSSSPNLYHFMFAENPVPFEGFSVPPEYAWDPLSDSGSNLFAASTDSDLFPASVNTSNYLFGTPNPSSAIGNEDAVAGLSITSLSSSPSRCTASGYQRRSSKIRVDRRIDTFREPGKTSSDQPNNSSDDNNNRNSNNKKSQPIMPAYSNEWGGFSTSPAPPLSPLGMADTSGVQSTLVQSLANLTTSSPNLSCLNSPTFSSTFSQSSNCLTFSSAQSSLSPDHLSGLYYTQGSMDDASGNKDEDNNEGAAKDDESDRRFQCPVCPKRFLRQYNLNAHLKTHSQVRAHACIQCDKTFLRPYDLARHQRIHSNTRPYTCNICQFIFIRNDAIWRHYRRAHPGHPDVPPARRQRRPQRVSTNPGPTTIITTTRTSTTVNSNINPSSPLHSSLTSPIRPTSTKSTASSAFTPHDMTSSSADDTSPSSYFSPPSVSATFTPMEIPSLD